MSFLACSMLTYAQQDTSSYSGESDFVVRPNIRQYNRTVECEVAGTQTRYNTSLSPLLQQGPNFGVYIEIDPIRVSSRESKLKKIFSNEIRLSPMSTIFGGGSMIAFSEKASYFLLYDFHPIEQFRVYAGGGLSGDFSLDISMVNSNNTSALGIDLSLVKAAVRPEYVVKAKRRDIKLYDSFNMSLARVSLLPNYGDLSQFDIKQNAFSYIDFTNRFTVQVPMRRTTLSLSHVLEREKVDRNLVERRRFVNSLAIGFNTLISRTSGRPMKYNSNGKRVRK